MLNHYRTIKRLIRIVWILARYRIDFFYERFLFYRFIVWMVGFKPGTEKMRRELSAPARLRRALEELGPTFIKFGQALSTRMDVLPEDVGLEMKKLQDAVPPFSFDIVTEIVEADLEGPLSRFFIYFNPVPVASASIAQVHHATTLGGRDVAVKVLRPNVAEIVDTDIHLLSTLANQIEAHIPDWRRFRVRRVVEEFAASIRNEINFQVEGSRAHKFRENFQLDTELRVPSVIWELTTTRVLTMEWLDGIPIDELTRQSHPDLDPAQVSKNLIVSFFKQVFRDGFFHADQHPGNIFVLKDGTVAIFDFGIIGRISVQDRIWLAELLQGFIIRDYRKVAEIHLAAGYVPRNTNIDEFEDACRQIAEPIFGQPLKDISIARLLAQLFKVTERFDMAVQPQLLLLQKTMLTLEGVGREINPELNMWVLAEPLIRDWMMENMGPKGKIRSARERFRTVSTAAFQFPELAMRSVEKVANDKLAIEVYGEALERMERRLSTGMKRMSMAVTGAGLFMGGAIMASSNLPISWFGPPLMLAAGYFFLAIMPNR
ncbi:MAG: ubiquinone biosynthesis protein UbiB [Magnetococcales bacterium]|nr:ubiquinone biosynthesis protein UbiB [Magnetococcales bacterium]HIJ85110.1 2-polyprenylphenol 6-hydroxylase [Magnetococcales bacterium]